MDGEKALHACVLGLIRRGLIRSAHDCSDGGLAVALAESCLSGPDRPRGAVVKLSSGRLRKDAVLFGESQSRVIVSARASDRGAILDEASRAGVPAAVIGHVTGDRLVIALEEVGANPVIDLPVGTLQDRWAGSLERTLHREEP
jgi:phosphoribosylformylglycinamidine synthase